MSRFALHPYQGSRISLSLSARKGLACLREANNPHLVFLVAPLVPNVKLALRRILWGAAAPRMRIWHAGPVSSGDYRLACHSAVIRNHCFAIACSGYITFCNVTETEWQQPLVRQQPSTLVKVKVGVVASLYSAPA